MYIRNNIFKKRIRKIRFWIIYIFVQILFFWGTVLVRFSQFFLFYFLSLANHSGQHFYSAPHHKKASYGPVSVSVQSNMFRSNTIFVLETYPIDFSEQIQFQRIHKLPLNIHETSFFENFLMQVTQSYRWKHYQDLKIIFVKSSVSSCVYRHFNLFKHVSVI